MNALEVGHLFISKGAAFHNVDLGGAKVHGQLDMTGATVTGTLNMDPLQVGQDLFMRAGTTVQDVDLGGAKIGGQLSLIDATVTGTLRMNRIEVGQSLLMRGPNAAFRDVDLTSAKICGQLDMSGANIAGTLTMNGLEIGQHLLMCGRGASFRHIALTAAKIGGQLDMTRATVCGKLTMESLEVGQHMLMWEATFEKRIDLIFSRVGANLDLSGADFSGAEFTGLDLSGTRIEGELRLGSGFRAAPKWRLGARLVLRNTHAGVSQDYNEEHADAWPDELRLDGFICGRLGGYRAETRSVHAELAPSVGTLTGWRATAPILRNPTSSSPSSPSRRRTDQGQRCPLRRSASEPARRHGGRQLPLVARLFVAQVDHRLWPGPAIFPCPRVGPRDHSNRHCLPCSFGPRAPRRSRQNGLQPGPAPADRGACELR